MENALWKPWQHTGTCTDWQKHTGSHTHTHAHTHTLAHTHAHALSIICGVRTVFNDLFQSQQRVCHLHSYQRPVQRRRHWSVASFTWFACVFYGLSSLCTHSGTNSPVNSLIQLSSIHFLQFFGVYIQVQMDLTLLSLSIKVFEFEFEFNVCFMQRHTFTMKLVISQQHVHNGESWLCKITETVFERECG